MSIDVWVKRRNEKEKSGSSAYTLKSVMLNH